MTANTHSTTERYFDLVTTASAFAAFLLIALKPDIVPYNDRLAARDAAHCENNYLEEQLTRIAPDNAGGLSVHFSESDRNTYLAQCRQDSEREFKTDFAPTLLGLSSLAVAIMASLIGMQLRSMRDFDTLKAAAKAEESQGPAPTGQD